MDQPDVLGSAPGKKAVSGCQPSAFDANRILCRLTAREREVFSLLGEGKTCADVARALHLARPTVTGHGKRLMQKLGLGAKADLLLLAVRVRLEPETGASTDARS
jgi:DNA-binding CsgD family transcriptional regulator